MKGSEVMNLKLLIKRAFTLIELIVVIVVLGILAAIVIPNVSNLKKESTYTAINSNVRNLQTSIDMYSLENDGSLPGIHIATVGNPQPIDFKKIKPKQLRNEPNTKGVKYWVDFQGKAWASTIDSPNKVIFDGTVLSWEHDVDAQSYNLYEIVSSTTSNASNANSKLKFQREVTNYTIDEEGRISISGLLGDDYAVSAIDENKFESPPSNSLYAGYIQSENAIEPEPVIEEPQEAPYSSEYSLTTAHNSLNMNFITYDGEKYYYANPSTGYLHSMNKENQTALVKNTRVRFLNQYKDYIYFDMNEFFRIDKKNLVVDNLQTMANQVDKMSGYNSVIKEDTIYAQSTYNPHTWYIFSMNLNTMETKYLTDFPVTRFLVVGDKIYYQRDNTGSNYLYRMNLDGSGKQLVIADKVRNFTINGDYIFYEYYSSENKMYRTNMDGGGKVFLRNQYSHYSNIYKENVIVSTSTNGTYIMDNKGTIIRHFPSLGSTVHRIVIIEDRIFVNNGTTIREIDEFGTILHSFN